jgi:hypothetical protein
MKGTTGMKQGIGDTNRAQEVFTYPTLPLAMPVRATPTVPVRGDEPTGAADGLGSQRSVQSARGLPASSRGDAIRARHTTREVGRNSGAGFREAKRDNPRNVKWALLEKCCATLLDVDSERQFGNPALFVRDLD